MTRKEVEQWYYAKAEITVDKEYNDAKLSHADVIEWLADFQQLLNKHDVGGRSEQVCMCYEWQGMFTDDDKVPYCRLCKLPLDMQNCH